MATKSAFGLLGRHDVGRIHLAWELNRLLAPVKVVRTSVSRKGGETL